MRIARSLLLFSGLLLPSVLLAQAYPRIGHFARTNWTIGAGTVSLSPRDTSMDFYSGTATISTNGNISGTISVLRFPSGNAAVSVPIATYNINPGSKISGPFRRDRRLTYTDFVAGVRNVYELEMYSGNLYLTAGGTPSKPVLTSKTRPDITYVRKTSFVGTRRVSSDQWFEVNGIYAAIFRTNGARGLLIISDPRIY